MTKYTEKQRIDVFWSHVDKSAGPDACWLWTGKHTRDGYGRLRWKGHNSRAHRVAWILMRGDPGPLSVLHNCPGGDNPACCNPNHLWLGTPSQNSADMVTKHRSAHGEKHGMHKLTAAQIEQIRQLYVPRKVTLEELGRRFGVHLSMISLIVRGKNWKS